MTRRRSIPVLAGALIAVACGPSALPDGDRRQVLGVLGNDIAVPTISELAEKADALDAAGSALASDPTPDNLDAAKQAWRDAREPWMRTLTFGFGPLKDKNLDAAIDQPVDVDRIEQVLTGTDVIDSDAVRQLGANKKGFHTLEYFLFLDPEGSTVLDALAAQDDAGSRRRAYVAGVATQLAVSAHALEDAWSPSGDDYLNRLTKPGSKEAAFQTVQAAIDAIMNQAVFLAELVTNTRLGKPLGNDNGGTPQPDQQESPWADSSVADMQNTLTGIQNAYFGTLNGKVGPKGLSLIVAQRSPGIDAHVKDALKKAMKAVDAIPLPYATALQDNQDDVQAAYEAVRDLKRVLATEVVTLLGAVLKFNDNDGD